MDISTEVKLPIHPLKKNYMMTTNPRKQFDLRFFCNCCVGIGWWRQEYVEVALCTEKMSTRYGEKRIKGGRYHVSLFLINHSFVSHSSSSENNAYDCVWRQETFRRSSLKAMTGFLWRQNISRHELRGPQMWRQGKEVQFKRGKAMPALL